MVTRQLVQLFGQSCVDCPGKRKLFASTDHVQAGQYCCANVVGEVAQERRGRNHRDIRWSSEDCCAISADSHFTYVVTNSRWIAGMRSHNTKSRSCV
jgi:hypothetical protein